MGMRSVLRRLRIGPEPERPAARSAVGLGPGMALAVGLVAVAHAGPAAHGRLATFSGRRVNILALGDSYTIGEGVAAGDAWPAQLARAIGRDDVATKLRVVARTGWTTDELAQAMRRARLRGPYDLVTLLIGVNDQYRGRELPGYRDRFEALLARAVALAGGAPGRVVVVSIPDWGVTTFAAGQDRAAIGAAIDRFNDAAREISARAGARWVDVTAVSRDAGAASGSLVADGLHPSAAQYARWVERILPAALAALKPS